MNEILIDITGSSDLLFRCAVVGLMWVLLFIATAIDFATGVRAAKARGDYVDSGGYRRSFKKLGEYWSVLVMMLLFDIIGSLFTWYALPYATMLGAAVAVAIELRSVMENLRSKKSAAAEIPEMLRKIIQCKEIGQAAELFQQLQQLNPNTSPSPRPADPLAPSDDWANQYPPLKP